MKGQAGLKHSQNVSQHSPECVSDHLFLRVFSEVKTVQIFPNNTLCILFKTSVSSKFHYVLIMTIKILDSWFDSTTFNHHCFQFRVKTVSKSLPKKSCFLSYFYLIPDLTTDNSTDELNACSHVAFFCLGLNLNPKNLIFINALIFRVGLCSWISTIPFSGDWKVRLFRFWSRKLAVSRPMRTVWNQRRNHFKRLWNISAALGCLNGSLWLENRQWDLNVHVYSCKSISVTRNVLEKRKCQADKCWHLSS